MTGEYRNYSYDARGRVLTEPFNLTGSANPTNLPNGPQTAQYKFDDNGGASTENGIGVRTLQQVNQYAGNQVLAQNNFQQATEEVNGDGNVTYQAVIAYDAAGAVNSRTVASGPAQTTIWDAWGHLVQVSQRNSGASDYDWTTVYDGLGRRVQTTWQPMNAGVASGASSTLTYHYDPQVEFLELGLNNNGDRTWRVYGPDRSGVYGGAQGIGGLENEVDENAGFSKVPLNNSFGDAVGETYVSAGGAATSTYSYGLTLGGYGPEPGTTLSFLTPEWRGKYADWTASFTWAPATTNRRAAGSSAPIRWVTVRA